MSSRIDEDADWFERGYDRDNEPEAASVLRRALIQHEPARELTPEQEAAFDRECFDRVCEQRNAWIKWGYAMLDKAGVKHYQPDQWRLRAALSKLITAAPAFPVAQPEADPMYRACKLFGERQFHDWRWLGWPLTDPACEQKWCEVCGLTKRVEGGKWVEAGYRGPRATTPTTAAVHEHRWVGRGEYGDTSSGYMCGDCGVDLDDTPEHISEAANAAALEICDYCGIDQNDSAKVASIISKHLPVQQPEPKAEVKRLREALRSYRKIVKTWQSHALITSRLLGCPAIDKEIEVAIGKLMHDYATARADAIGEAIELAKSKTWTTANHDLSALDLEECSTCAAALQASELVAALEQLKGETKP